MTSKTSNGLSPGALRRFASGPDGAEVEQVCIGNGGTQATIMTWGASVQDLRRQELDYPLVLGSSDFSAYLDKMLYFGAIVGPVANRIAGGRFDIGDECFELEKNERGKTTLHGGFKGTGQRNWRVLALAVDRVTLGVRHRHGEAGFPGNVDVIASYWLDREGALNVDIAATTDRITPLNFAHHGYWNLDGSANIANHTMQISASHYLPVDKDQIPLGGPKAVAGTPFDYRTPTSIKSPYGSALDHNFCIDRAEIELSPICTLAAGRVQLEISSTERGLQVYNALEMDTAPYTGHRGVPYRAQAGLALEPQNWPNAPNRADFPSVFIEPGKVYKQTSRFRLIVSHH